MGGEPGGLATNLRGSTAWKVIQPQTRLTPLTTLPATGGGLRGLGAESALPPAAPGRS
jgi:hypothetical protein